MDLRSVRRTNEPSKKQKYNQGLDIISNLPDFIIGEILCFLPIKEAVGTSVLSKRWKHMWTFITKLHFDDRLYYFSTKNACERYYNFVNSVNRVLFDHNNLSIQSFSLAISGEYTTQLVNSWISSILNRRVRKLSVTFRSLRGTFSFKSWFDLNSRSRFNYDSLEEMVLNMSWSIYDIRIFSTVYLPCLKFLNLYGVTFACKSGEMNFSFPVLEKFEARHCNWNQSVTFTVPLLERITIEKKAYSPYCYRRHNNHAIKFSASHLTEFTYRGNITQDIVLLDPSSACNCSINLFLNYDESDKEAGPHAYMLLKQFNQVESLKLDKTEVLVFEDLIEYFADLPTFQMLRHLELGSVIVEVLFGLLAKSPLLKTLVLEDICEFDKDLLDYGILPKCLISTLKVIKFRKLNGYEHELCLASYLMENALVLERMHFSPARCLIESDLAMEEIKQRLLEFKKGFAFAIIEIS